MAASTTFRLRLLGEAELMAPDGSRVPLPAKALALLAHLALESGQRHQRRRLAELLWPDRSPDKQRASLRLALHKIREAAGEGEGAWLESDREHVQVIVGDAPRQLAVDILDFLHGASAPPHPAVADLAPPGCADFEQWWSAWAERVRLAGVSRLAHAARRAIDEGRPSLAEDQARQLLRLDDLSEEGHELLVRALLAQDRAAEAVRQVRECETVLHRELGVAPSRVITDLIARDPRRVADAPDADAPLETLPLPTALTSFYGRVEEIAALQSTIRERGARLLSILGPGGMGKTRLALEVAHAAGRSFDEGAVFLAMDRLHRVEEIPDALADVLGLRSVVLAEDPFAALIEVLRDREVLIVADNAEHLLDDGAATMLATLVSSCPHVVVLTTSREGLDVGGEDSRALTGLRWPTADDEDVDTFDAVRLLVDRLHRADKSIRLEPGTEGPIRQICEAVEGMPLGLELAASAIRVQSLDEIAMTLQTAPQMLPARLRDAPDRHADLAAVYEHSVSQLQPAHRAVMARLGVFRGGFTPAAADEVADAGPAVLAHLCRHSLLDRRTDGRYRQHELLRQLALTDLDESGEGRACRDRHARHHLRRLASAAPALNVAGAQRVVEALDEDAANLRAAWSWGINQGMGGEVVAASSGLVSWATTSARVPDAEQMLGDAAEIVGPGRHRAILLLRQATLAAQHLTRMDDLERLCDRGLSELAALDGTTDDVRALRAETAAKFRMLLGVNLVEGQGRLDEGRALLDQAEREAGRGAPVVNAFLSLRRGYNALDVADFGTAEQRMRNAAEALDEAGHTRGSAMALKGLAHVFDEQYALWPALMAIRDAAELFDAMGNRRRQALCAETQGHILVRLGQFDTGLSMLDDAVTYFRSIGQEHMIGPPLITLATAQQGLGDRAAAEATFERALALLAGEGDSNMVRFALFPCAWFMVEQGRHLEAELIADDLIRMNAKMRSAPMEAAARALRAVARLRSGRADGATADVDAAWEVLADADVARRLQDPLGTLMDLHLALAVLGRQTEAEAVLGHAHGLVRTVAAEIRDPLARATYLRRAPYVAQVLDAIKAEES